MGAHSSPRIRRKRTQAKVPKGALCSYCDQKPATDLDHISPHSYSFNQAKENLTPACRRCNLLAGSKVFDSFEEKRIYILDRLAATMRLVEARCPNGCGPTYVRKGQNDRCPDCGESL